MKWLLYDFLTMDETNVDLAKKQAELARLTHLAQEGERLLQETNEFLVKAQEVEAMDALLAQTDE
jgi:hypothetical protein